MLFFDECLVGVKEYSLDGTFLGEHIRQGRGPDEMISPSWIAAYDEYTNVLLIQDAGAAHLHLYDMDYHRIWETHKPFYMLDSTVTASSATLQSLYYHPDPERYEMYEYNLDCHRMAISKGTIVMPIVSDHVRFNKYYLCANSKSYYEKAHTFLVARIDTLSFDFSPIGNYPPVYKKGTLSIFSEYDFFVQDGYIYISFAADPKIYKMNMSGTIISSFGFREGDIAGVYPDITTFEDYEKNYGKQRASFGYYGRMLYANGYIFRTCKLDTPDKYSLQIYEMTTCNLIADISMENNIELLGFHDGYYYAYIGDDLEQEVFKVVKFRI